MSKLVFLIGTERKLSLLASDDRKKSSFQNTACENTWTVDNVHNKPYLL
jgi:hypothetical protein